MSTPRGASAEFEPPRHGVPGRLGAVVLTGGAGSRLGGVDKASIEVGAITLLEGALTATGSAHEVVVVGKQVPTSRPVTWTLEDPAGGGPAAGLLAGVDAFAVPPDIVFVLAVDMPRVTASTVTRLLDALNKDGRVDAVVVVDDEGEQQTLAGIYRYSALMSARPADHVNEHGLSIRRLIAPLRVSGIASVADEARDVDTWEDLRDLGK